MLLIGKSAQENWDIIDSSDPEWIWLHLKSFPSAHIVITESDPDMDLIIHAAECCKNATKYKNLRNLKVSYCKIKNLKKAEKVGSVYFKSNRKVKQVLI